MQDALPDSNLIPETRSQVFVVVPSHNHARFLEKCLRSVMKQTAQPRKLLVIDDGSSDDSPHIAERALKDCAFDCELIVKANRGLSATLNEALSRADGDYFAYLGSDDVWLPAFLATRVEMLKERRSAVLAYGNAYSIDEADAIIDCSADWAAYVDGDVRQMLMTTLAPLSPTVVYRRNALERHGWNERAKLEDYELYLRLSVDGEFAFDPLVLAAWRVHGENASFDLNMMMNEKLEAQKKVGADLGFTQQELRKFRSIAMFRSAQEFQRRGERKQALQLMIKNLGGIQSPEEAMRILAGLATPGALLRWRRARKHKDAGSKYGSLEI